MKTINCSGLACPKPVIMTKKEFDNGTVTELMVIVDNEAASINVSKFASSIGANFEIEKKENLYYISLTRELSQRTEDKTNCEILSFSEEALVILVSGDTLGTGDDKLGAALMKSYMYALTESEKKPKTMMFLNSGVKLTSDGSDVIESIKQLESMGTEILSCGTCLDFYNLKEKLLIGSITNMYTIIEKMHAATNTIKL